jgi:hypothetical protein
VELIGAWPAQRGHGSSRTCPPNQIGNILSAFKTVVYAFFGRNGPSPIPQM